MVPTTNTVAEPRSTLRCDCGYGFGSSLAFGLLPEIHHAGLLDRKK